MAYSSNRLILKLRNRLSEKTEAEGRRKNSESSVNHFECAADTFTMVFVICGLILAVITAICVVLHFMGNKDAIVGISFFGAGTVLSLFAGWAVAHHRLIVDGNEVTYVNVWGIVKRFHFSEVTKCLTTEQSLSLYAGSKKVASLSNDVYGLDLLKARCKKNGIEVRNKGGAGITKFTLVWHASRTLAIIFFWAAVGISLLMIPVRVSSVGFSLSDIPFLLKIDLLLVGGFASILLLLMLCFAIGLKEVRSIEKALGISFAEEMARRGAEGREYQDEEWFVESIPGKIEVLNRRFIKHWQGIKDEYTSGTTMYHVEFIDIYGKRRKIGGYYKEYAVKMNNWYYKK